VSHTPGKLKFKLGECNESGNDTAAGSLVGQDEYGVEWYIAAIEGDTDRWQDDGERLEACWNGCEGLNPKAVPKMLEALKEVHAALHEAIKSINVVTRLATGEEVPR